MEIYVRKGEIFSVVGYLKPCNGGSCYDVHFKNPEEFRDFFDPAGELEIKIEEGDSIGIKDKKDFMFEIGKRIVAIYPTLDGKYNQILGLCDKEGLIDV